MFFYLRPPLDHPPCLLYSHPLFHCLSSCMLQIVMVPAFLGNCRREDTASCRLKHRLKVVPTREMFCTRLTRYTRDSHSDPISSHPIPRELPQRRDGSSCKCRTLQAVSDMYRRMN